MTEKDEYKMPYLGLQKIEVTLWNRYRVAFTPHPDVNIIVGINGSGKTTLLSEIFELIPLKDQGSCIYIPSIDNLIIRDKRKKETALSQDLDAYVYDMKTGPSLMSYRMTMLDASPDKQTEIRSRINELIDIINSLFKDTGKKITIEGNQFLITSGDQVIPVSNLSSGEKMMLLLLLRVFLLNGKESIVLIDEPENSLDINWQYRLIDLLVRLNPKAQFFITTHSPSIFSDGWGDRIIYMEDITSPLAQSYW